jgi:hypothetical protein
MFKILKFVGHCGLTHGGNCTSSYGGGGRVYLLHCRKLTVSPHNKDLGDDGRIILKRILKKWDGDMDWIHLAQNRDR